MLESLSIQGFRSIRDIAIELRPLNVLIGANGSGKSNLIAFFRMLHEMVEGRLQGFLAASGRATSNLYLGPQITPKLKAEIRLRLATGLSFYRFQLSYGAGDSLFFGGESFGELSETKAGESKTPIGLGFGHLESRLRETAKDVLAAKPVVELLEGFRVYHFHDTSSTSAMRQFGYVGDTLALRADAGNLAAILSAYRQSAPVVFRRILSTSQMVFPDLADFVLKPDRANSREITLNWTRRGSDHLFGPHQLSDGTLRAIALITLLLQPEKELPALIVLDEPELGLHPHALEIVAGLIRAASLHSQVLVATQSSSLLSFFEPDEVLIVETTDGASEYKRLDSTTLLSWLEDYNLGELWQRNIVGGGPLS